jgi:thiol-disulfide isomerase/thioredoxin
MRRRPACPAPYGRPAVLGLVIGLAACANVAPTESSPATDGFESEPRPAPGGSTGGVCAETTECPAGQSCVGGVCLQLCTSHQECASSHCAPFAGSTVGYCSMPGGAAPPGDDPGTAPAPPDDPAGEPSPPFDPGPGDEPGGAPAPPADGPGDKPPPEDESGPAPEAPADPPESPPDTPEAPDSEPPAACRYPAADETIALGRTMPYLAFPNARDAANTVQPLDLESFHCDPAWSRYSAMAVVIGTGWCSACVEYDAQLAQVAAAFEAAGGLFVMVEVEDANYAPVDSAGAWRILDRSFGDAPGLRVGDADTRPSPNTLSSQGIVASYPTAFVVRRSDMRVIYDQAREAYTLDYPAIAREAAGGPAPGPDGGGACAEEPGEPNDTSDQATPLPPGVEVGGGICDRAPDYFRIDHAGAWRVDLTFRHADGDLDLYLWDAGRNDVAYGNNGRPLGSDSADDDERFSGTGPATLQIVGYEGARASYRLRLTPQ